MRAPVRFGLGLLFVASVAQAADEGLSPSKVFELASPSIVVIEAHDKVGAVIALGSGVAIGNGVVVSNCHVFTKADTATVRYRQKNISAKLRYADNEHDLCSFTVAGLTAPPVRMGSTSQLKVGEPAFAIGAPEGLELTLSGGLISSLRHILGGVVLQVTTPISPGSSGGGLFDNQARLIGITSYYMKEGQQLNFAVPVDWINELPQRGKLASEGVTPPKKPAEITASTMPATDLQKGHQAFLSGDGATALAVLGPLAKQGNVRAQCDLGAMYMAGEGVPQDYGQAVAWYRKAAVQGDATAQWGLGFMYAGGEGVPQDYAQAAVWYRKAAEQGSSLAQDSLGRLYDSGQGVPQDYGQAVAWYRKAAGKGNASAQCDLGAMYMAGEGVPQDYGQAVAWYRKAAVQGDATAQGALGWMYDSGYGVTKNLTEAMVWYRRAVAQGNAVAQWQLGSKYYLGDGVPKNDEQAVTLFRLSAAQGLADAQTDLGHMYHFGGGVPQNFVAAYALYNFAMVNRWVNTDGQKIATSNRRKMMDSMTPAQVEAGQALTREMQRVGVPPCQAPLRQLLL